MDEQTEVKPLTADEAKWLESLKQKIEYVAPDSIELSPNKERVNDSTVPALANSIRTLGFRSPIYVDAAGIVRIGHTRLKAARALGLKKVPIVRLEADLPAEKIRLLQLADNKIAEMSEWNMPELQKSMDELQDSLEDLIPDFDFADFGFTDARRGMPEGWDEDMKTEGGLATRFGVPPFSVLFGYSGAWVARKKMWKERVASKGESREYTLAGKNSLMACYNAGVSLFDPVLAELCCKWFAPDGGSIVDPFAGDTLKGLVFGMCGHPFCGIELRQEQVKENEKILAQYPDIKDVRYVCDDGKNVGKHIKPASQDFLFSCPPYYDLEVYSDKPNDASNQPTYEAFLDILRSAFHAAIKCLKDNRFAVVVVGDIRDKNGYYRCFPDDVKRIFVEGGMSVYNDIIMVDRFGTASVRANSQMKNRKVVKVHQNVLVFYKGDPHDIQKDFKPIDLSQEDCAGFLPKEVCAEDSADDGDECVDGEE
jgi:hypothetical protein